MRTEADNAALVDLCNCGHNRERHGGMHRNGSCHIGGCSCVRFTLTVLHPSKAPIVAERMAALAAAREASAKAKASIEATLDAEMNAVRGVTQAFLDLYNELPEDVRNKIRHAINTTRDGTSPNDPKKAE